LACLSTSTSSDKLAFDVGLQEESEGEACWWTIHPSSKQRSEGEKVRVGDDAILVSVATERYLVNTYPFSIHFNGVGARRLIIKELKTNTTSFKNTLVGPYLKRINIFLNFIFISQIFRAHAAMCKKYLFLFLSMKNETTLRIR
jgi:hypothetical protein